MSRSESDYHRLRTGKTDKICPKCKEIMFMNFGKLYCRSCYAREHATGRPGQNSMMLIGEHALKSNLSQQRLFSHEEITVSLGIPKDYPILIPTHKGDRTFATLFRQHYPGSLGIIGRSLNYFIVLNNEIIGIIGAASPPMSLELMDKHWGITKENRYDKLLTVMNNNIFKIISHGKDKDDHNIGTKALKVFRKQVKIDYEKKFPGSTLKGLITFVQPPRTGSIYVADNWKYLGMTKGFRTTQREGILSARKFEFSEKEKKHIFVYDYLTDEEKRKLKYERRKLNKQNRP